MSNLVPLWVGWSLIRAFYRLWPEGEKYSADSFCKHPVVAVAHAEVVVGVAQAVKFQGGTELLLHFFGQLCMVEGNVMLGIGESGQQRATAFRWLVDWL